MGTASGPLSGLRVMDGTGDTGRFATKVLAELGADVVRVYAGPHVTRGPSMRDPLADAQGGLLDWWCDGGKETVPLDLSSAADAATYRALAARADLIIDTQRPGVLATLGLDHGDLLDVNPRLVQVSLTPFGRTGPRSQWQVTDLVAAALGGTLSVCGTPEEAVVPWGRQSFAAGSLVAALSGIAGVRHARRTGAGQLIDLSLHEAVTSSLEQIWFQYFYDDRLPLPKIAPRQGSLHWSRNYQVLPCRTGWCMITATPAPMALIAWLVEEMVPGASELAAEVQEAGALQPGVHGPRLVQLAGEFALTKDADELFWEAQRRHLAWGSVQTVAQLATNEQFAFRGALVSASDVARVRRPRFPVVFSSTPAPPPSGPRVSSTAEVLERWNAGSTPTTEATEATASSSENGANTGDPIARPLEGIRVIDFSWVLAGPFCCRLLGDLGADVVKVQTAARATTVNDPENGFYPVFNRSKRSVALDMKADGALDVFRRLIESADVLIENYAAGVLARWGITWESLHSWNPRLVYVTMSGCGHDGPWSSVVSYGPTIHAMSGLTSLSNPPGRGDVGAGYALNDMAVGAVAATCVTAALEARERTGEGQFVDLAQVEVGAYMVGAAIVDHLSNGREAVPTGNLDPYSDAVFEEVLKTAEGEVAVSVRDADDLASLQTVIGAELAALPAWCSVRSAGEVQSALQGAGVPAGKVQNANDLFTDDPQLAARDFFGQIESDQFGLRPFDRFPAHWGRSVLDPYRCAPNFVGEHSFEVLAEVGMTDEEIGEALAAGILA